MANAFPDLPDDDSLLRLSLPELSGVGHVFASTLEQRMGLDKATRVRPAADAKATLVNLIKDCYFDCLSTTEDIVKIKTPARRTRRTPRPAPASAPAGEYLTAEEDTPEPTARFAQVAAATLLSKSPQLSLAARLAASAPGRRSSVSAERDLAAPEEQDLAEQDLAAPEELSRPATEGTLKPKPAPRSPATGGKETLGFVGAAELAVERLRMEMESEREQRQLDLAAQRRENELAQARHEAALAELRAESEAKIAALSAGSKKAEKEEEPKLDYVPRYDGSWLTVDEDGQESVKHSAWKVGRSAGDSDQPRRLDLRQTELYDALRSAEGKLKNPGRYHEYSTLYSACSFLSDANQYLQDQTHVLLNPDASREAKAEILDRLTNTNVEAYNMLVRRVNTIELLVRKEMPDRTEEERATDAAQLSYIEKRCPGFERLLGSDSALDEAMAAYLEEFSGLKDAQTTRYLARSAGEAAAKAGSVGKKKPAPGSGVRSRVTVSTTGSTAISGSAAAANASRAGGRT